ncbi:hypothetical protein J8273_5617 [Carpediemonas membranifera]|uniref:Cytidyltransferase-like domain-containing protein n=1 Tax=Carpediemonas membranifera TaxID=201153 RepID=A0A8J6E3D7_9EUKA|nr:hypothetical protein J8273_5617 [Carpediemonas membranifera]|eukprot:KAG9393022.1 hypothetical protein J8273_5617 [Carpediemonas membranifera]
MTEYRIPQPPRDGQYEKRPAGTIEYDLVAVAGTFDRLHIGHYALLSASLLVTDTDGTIMIGVTTPELQKNKANGHLIQSYEDRCQAIRLFLETLGINVGKRLPKLDIFELNDPVGPAGTIASLEALIISEETLGGLEHCNKVRLERGLAPLDAVVIPVVHSDNGDKVSSTALRQGAPRVEKMKALMAKRDSLVKEISQLTQLSDVYPHKLTDSEGYPLSDVPIMEVRAARSKLAERITEHKVVMERLEMFILDKDYDE